MLWRPARLEESEEGEVQDEVIRETVEDLRTLVLTLTEMGGHTTVWQDLACILADLFGCYAGRD